MLGPGDDITRFEYLQKNQREQGPALVGIELSNKGDYATLLARMASNGVEFTEIGRDDKLYGFLI